jgi:integrase
VSGEPVQVADPAYELRYYENRQAVYEEAGKNATEADAKRLREQAKRTATVIAVDAGLVVHDGPERRAIRQSVEAFIGLKEASGHEAAATHTRIALNDFLDYIGRRRTYVDEVTTEDVLGWRKWLKGAHGQGRQGKRGNVRGKNSDRTVANKHDRLASWLQYAGYPKEKIPPAPKYEEKVPTVFSRAQVGALLEAAEPDMRLYTLLMTMCGLRSQELSYLTWADIDFEARTLAVRGKQERDIFPGRTNGDPERWLFKVKDSEQRRVTLPDELVTELQAWREQHPRSVLVLPSRNGGPRTGMLDVLKALAHRAGLDCGRCPGCLKGTGCQEYTQHKFRRTMMTTLLRNGVDLKTVQTLAGHSDMKSTMRYLRAEEGEALRAKVNAVAWH